MRVVNILDEGVDDTITSFQRDRSIVTIEGMRRRLRRNAAGDGIKVVSFRCWLQDMCGKNTLTFCCCGRGDCDWIA